MCAMCVCVFECVSECVSVSVGGTGHQISIMKLSADHEIPQVSVIKIHIL